MSACTFFGHKDAPKNLRPLLVEVISELYTRQKADTFYVGQQGSYDFLVYSVLKELKNRFPDLKYYVVLAYLPEKAPSYTYYSLSETIYPEGLESVPPRFAISKRNRWLIDNSQTVVTYVNRSFGGAAQFEKIAQKENKTVINLCRLLENR